MKKHILIHIALKQEAKPIIEHFKLNCIESKPFKIYKRDDILLVVCGMGAEKTAQLENIFSHYQIELAVNIGIAGCKDKSIEIGSIFCTNQKLDFVDYETLTSVDKPIDDKSVLSTTLVDMEAFNFESICKKYLKDKDIFILKVVSDYLDTTIPKKEFIWKIIKKNLINIDKIVNLKN